MGVLGVYLAKKQKNDGINRRFVNIYFHFLLDKCVYFLSTANSEGFV